MISGRDRSAGGNRSGAAAAPTRVAVGEIEQDDGLLTDRQGVYADVIRSSVSSPMKVRFGDIPLSARILPILPGVPAAAQILVVFRYSICSDALKCLANSYTYIERSRISRYPTSHTTYPWN